MNDTKLAWRETGRVTICDASIFSIAKADCLSPNGEHRQFSLVECNHWAMVIPVIKHEGADHFIMVRQWRHGAQEISLEFPGGVIETGECIADGAGRELREETGWLAGKLTLLGTMNPNPAFMCNTVSFFLAEELRFDGEQRLDNNEFVAVELRRTDDVVRDMGKPPFIHALMASALSFWQTAKTAK